MFWFNQHKNRVPSMRVQREIRYYMQQTASDPNRARYCFSGLYGALFCDPSPQQMQWISTEAHRLIQGRDAFYAASLMSRVWNVSFPAETDLWKQHCSPEGYQALLTCGTTHPNGFFREHCLKCLADTIGLQFIMLRMNDWVPAIRVTAWKMMQERLRCIISCDELIAAMPFVEYVRRGNRARRNASFSMDAFDDSLMRIFADHPDAVLKSPLPLRRLCYKVFLLHPDSAYQDLLLHFIRNERDGTQRSALVRCCLKSAENAFPSDALDVFLQDPFWRVRLDACEYRIKHEGFWDGMETLLCSPHERLREFAAYYLAKNGYDTIGYCRKHLPETLSALGDIGSREDLPLIRPYLESHPCEALAAMVRLGAEDSMELVWKALNSGIPALEKTAYRLAGTYLHYQRADLIPVIQKESDPKRCWRLIRLLKGNLSSDLLPVLIRLVRDAVQIRFQCLRMIEQMTQYRAAGHHAVIVSQKAKDAILDALSEAGDAFPVNLRDYITGNMLVRD